MSDAKQVGGTHYNRLTIQPWDVIESWEGEIGFASYLRGNILKYLARYRSKNGVEDLQKASHYLEKLIELESRK